MRIVIGSTNPVKCRAARRVLEPLFPGAEFEALDVPAGIPAQPWGDVQTRAGALNRARAALARTGADLAVGLEGGVCECEQGLFTNAWCALIDGTGRIGIGGNACVMLPEPVADEVRRGHELGDAVDRLVGQRNTKHGSGAIGILTNALETRQSAYEVIIRFALAPFQNPDWYTGVEPTSGAAPTNAGEDE